SQALHPSTSPGAWKEEMAVRVVKYVKKFELDVFEKSEKEDYFIRADKIVREGKEKMQKRISEEARKNDIPLQSPMPASNGVDKTASEDLTSKTTTAAAYRLVRDGIKRALDEQLQMVENQDMEQTRLDHEQKTLHEREMQQGRALYQAVERQLQQMQPAAVRHSQELTRSVEQVQPLQQAPLQQSQDPVQPVDQVQPVQHIQVTVQQEQQEPVQHSLEPEQPLQQVQRAPQVRREPRVNHQQQPPAYMSKHTYKLIQQQRMLMQMDESKRRQQMYAEREADKKKIEELEAKMVEKDSVIAEIKVVNDALINQIQEEVADNLKMEENMEEIVIEKDAAIAKLSEENEKLTKQMQIEVSSKREKEAELDRTIILRLRRVEELTEKNEKLAILEREKEELRKNMEEVTISNRLMKEQIEVQKEMHEKTTKEVREKNKQLTILQSEKLRLFDKVQVMSLRHNLVQSQMETQKKKYEDTKIELTKSFNEKLNEAETERMTHVSVLKKRMDADHETAVQLMNEVEEKEDTIKELKEAAENMNEEMERLRKIEMSSKRIEELENGKTFCGVTITGFCWFMLIVSLLVTTVTSIFNWSIEDPTLISILFGINIGLAVLDLFALVDIGNRKETELMTTFRLLANLFGMVAMLLAPSYLLVMSFRFLCLLACALAGQTFNQIAEEARKLKELIRNEVKEERNINEKKTISGEVEQAQ
ncbi:hypothetical protein PFISCL1PPCAC_9566, partial [Pristionchus fissidentatus]